MKEKLKKILEMKAEYQAALERESSEILKGVFKEFFDKFENCLGIDWTQYTPYFNDGEECVFSVGSFTFWFTNFEGDREHYSVMELEDIGRREIPQFIRENKDIAGLNLSTWGLSRSSDKELFGDAFDDAKDLVKIDQEVYKVAFGDHVQIFATREGFEVSEYDHE